jgi:hypothetical protein
LYEGQVLVVNERTDSRDLGQFTLGLHQVLSESHPGSKFLDLLAGKVERQITPVTNAVLTLLPPAIDIPEVKGSPPSRSNLYHQTRAAEVKEVCLGSTLWAGQAGEKVFGEQHFCHN